MNIGQAAAVTGVSSKRIRYYEQVGLLQKPGRTYSGYRTYDERDLHLLRFIQRARRLGFSVPRISELLGLWQDRERSSADVKRLAQQHIEELQQKIDELQSMVDTLKDLSNRCGGDLHPDCPILNALERVES